MLAIEDSLSRCTLEEEFEKLAARWRADTSHLSRLDKIVSHPAYLKIIGMGHEALPFILRELQQRVDYCFTALEAISRAAPAQQTEPVNMNEMASAWIAWGQRHGYC